MTLLSEMSDINTWADSNTKTPPVGEVVFYACHAGSHRKHGRLKAYHDQDQWDKGAVPYLRARISATFSAGTISSLKV